MLVVEAAVVLKLQPRHQPEPNTMTARLSKIPNTRSP